MKSIGIILSLFVLVGCGTAKDARRHDGRPTLTAEQIETLRGQPFTAQKEAVVKEYENYLKRYDRVDPTLTSQARKRLGDLYLETANQDFIEAMKSYETRPQGPPPLIDYGKAIETYEAILRATPDYPENDQVLYALSRAYAETGDGDRAIELLEKLLGDYPKSRFRQEASFRLGEYYFDRRRYEEAAGAYEQSLALKDPFFLDKAQYKLGWTYFNMKEYPRAIENFLQLVNQKVTPEGEVPSEQGSLVWEAMTYVADSFRILGGAVPLSSYFEEKGSAPYEKELYLMIGNQYMSAGDPGSAIEAYRTFIRRHPLHPTAPIFSSYVMEVYEKQKDRPSAEATRIQLVKDYASKSDWYRANDDAARARSRPIVKAALYRLALSSHARAQEEKRDRDYREAAGWYRQFLAEFPQEKESPEVHLYLAETLFALKDFSQAGAEYETAAYGYPGQAANPKAAYDAVVSYEKVKTPEGDQKVIELSKRFAAGFPEDPKTPALLLKAGEILFEAKHYDETLVLLQGSLVRYPKQAGSATALKLVAHSFMQTGRFDEARQAYRQTIDAIPSSDAKARLELTELLAAVIYKQAENRKREHRPEDAARLFEDVAEQAPQSDLAPPALLEAGTLREGLNQAPEAIAVYRKLVRLAPDSVFSGKAGVQLGLLYEKNGEWIQAADAYVSAARIVMDETLVPRLLFTAGLYYEKAAQWDSTYDVFSTFTESFPENPDTAEAFLKMALVRQKQGKARESRKLFEQVARNFPGTPFAAEALFQKAEEAFRDLKAIPLKEPLHKSLKKKAGAMEKAITLYRNAIETRFSDVVTASSYRLGEVFEHFKTSLLNAEPPRKLTKDEREEYRFQLEEKAFPFEEKAIEAYASNVRRVQSQDGSYNEWIKKSYVRLAELRPALFQRPERAERIVTVIDRDRLSTQILEEPQGSIVKATR